MIYLFDDLDGKIYLDPFFLQYILITFFYTGYTGLNAKFPQKWALVPGPWSLTRFLAKGIEEIKNEKITDL